MENNLILNLNIFKVKKNYQKEAVKYSKRQDKIDKESKYRCCQKQMTNKQKAAMGLAYAGVGFLTMIVLLTFTFYQMYLDISPCIVINNLAPISQNQYETIVSHFRQCTPIPFKTN